MDAQIKTIAYIHGSGNPAGAAAAAIGTAKPILQAAGLPTYSELAEALRRLQDQALTASVRLDIDQPGFDEAERAARALLARIPS